MDKLNLALEDSSESPRRYSVDCVLFGPGRQAYCIVKYHVRVRQYDYELSQRPCLRVLEHI